MLPLRAIELHAKDVLPEQQRDVEELIKSVRSRLNIGQKLRASVELRLPSRRQVAAEALVVELGLDLQWKVAEEKSGS
jgi:uncharacterized protein with von Willebrand factor type A (vWA) domain